MGKRLLLVEDEATLARAVARLLRRAGYDVFLAGGCDEARRASGTFSLGIFDLELPDGDGLELAKELSEKAVVRRVVFFTGTRYVDHRQRASKLGPVVEKASGFPALRATIELALASQHAKVSGAEGVRIGETSDPPPSGIKTRNRSN